MACGYAAVNCPQIDTESLAGPEVRAVKSIVDDLVPPVEAPFFCSGEILLVSRTTENAAYVINKLFGAGEARHTCWSVGPQP